MYQNDRPIQIMLTPSNQSTQQPTITMSTPMYDMITGATPHAYHKIFRRTEGTKVFHLMHLIAHNDTMHQVRVSFERAEITAADLEALRDYPIPGSFPVFQAITRLEINNIWEVTHVTRFECVMKFFELYVTTAQMPNLKEIRLVGIDFYGGNVPELFGFEDALDSLAKNGTKKQIFDANHKAKQDIVEFGEMCRDVRHTIITQLKGFECTGSFTPTVLWEMTRMCSQTMKQLTYLHMDATPLSAEAMPPIYSKTDFYKIMDLSMLDTHASGMPNWKMAAKKGFIRTSQEFDVLIRDLCGKEMMGNLHYADVQISSDMECMPRKARKLTNFTIGALLLESASEWFERAFIPSNLFDVHTARTVMLLRAHQSAAASQSQVIEIPSPTTVVMC